MRAVLVLAAVLAWFAVDARRLTTDGVVAETHLEFLDSGKYRCSNRLFYADSCYAGGAMALTGNHDLQLWPLERGKKYILLVTPVEIVEQEQGGAALGGGIRSVSGGTFNQDDMRIEHIGEETIRVDFEIPADYESDEERLMGHPDVYRTVFRLPDIELKQVKK